MPGYDTNYYDSYLKPLYQPSQNTQGIYEVDTFLFDSANTQFNDTIFSFNKINGITFTSENLSLANTRANDVSTSNSDVDYTESTAIPETTDTSFTKLKDSAEKEYVRVNITASPTENVPFDALMQSITDNIPSSIPDTSNHNKMNEYMRDIFIGVSKYYFRNNVIIIKSLTNDQSTYFKQAQYYLGSLSNSKFNLLFQDIEDATKKTLYKIVKAKIIEYVRYNKTHKTPSTQKKLTEGFIINLSNLNGPLYYKLRIETVKALILKSQYFNVGENPAISLYFKMIAVDLYIKSSKYLMAYDYISCLTDTYVEYGDFINSRLGLLAKVIYTYYYANDINSTYKTSGSSTDIVTIVTIVTNLKNYLTNINGSSSAVDLHVGLHDKSNKVVSQNETVQSLSKQIKQNQLAMRNVIYNTGTLRKQYQYKMVEFIILIMILIIIITVSCVLLFLETEENGFKTYVLYICGITVLIILILSLAKIISNIVKKSY
jgi:t-SNARE complex subunit (syntaxin)